MFTNALCKTFQRLKVTAKGSVALRYCSTNSSEIFRSNASAFLSKPTIDFDKSIYEPNFRLSSVRSLDLDLPNRPASVGEIGEFPLDSTFRIGEPPMIYRKQEDVVPDKSLDLPSNETIVEKRAERMIVIRRRKMRRHKLKKLRKRMKYVWAKLRYKRQLRKEKAFHAELLGKIKKAEKFDAKAYVASRLAILDNVRIPSKYRGEILPEWQIREFMEQDRIRREKKFNKPRLTL